jgi:hypothetical protein
VRYVDEVTEISESAWRAGVCFAERARQRTARNRARAYRRARSQQGWWNWYANRGRISISFMKKDLPLAKTLTKGEFRRVSWRRAH